MKENNIEILEALNKSLLDLAIILEKESEHNWQRAIDEMLKRVECALSGVYDPVEAISYVRKTYMSINSGNGSFGDFYIWRDNFSDRKRENERLEEIKNKILKLLTS